MPTELIKPILPAAAASVKIKLGIAQNAGMYAFSPMSAMVKSNTARANRILNDSEAGINNVQPSATAPSVNGHGAVQPPLAGAIRAPADHELPDQPADGRDEHEPGELAQRQLVPLLQDAGQEELDTVAGRHHEEIGRGQEEHLGMLKGLEDRHVTVSLLVLLFLAHQFLFQGIPFIGRQPVRFSGPIGQMQEDQDPQDHRWNSPGNVHPLPALHSQKRRVMDRYVAQRSRWCRS